MLKWLKSYFKQPEPEPEIPTIKPEWCSKPIRHGPKSLKCLILELLDKTFHENDIELVVKSQYFHYNLGRPVDIELKDDHFTLKWSNIEFNTDIKIEKVYLLVDGFYYSRRPCPTLLVKGDIFNFTWDLRYVTIDGEPICR